ncbi:GL12025 [Drosophila persimilis]|uniref:Arfaptin-2 n=2 Tax=pseudoobscura subgroup TaxID=32358 RepID=A0A6I8URW6_DROPS|nr:arfaptin-2 [Drosophila pseudoobscura]XP_002019773.1 arfaptin-2 [Drosophila persimilis]EDW38407.1 GL12025 [Drosophila persimilis]
MAERERSIHEMLKDTPSMNDSCGAVHTGTEGGSSMVVGIGLCGSVSSHSIGVVAGGGGGAGVSVGGPFNAPNSLPLRNHSAPTTPMSPTSPTCSGNGMILTSADGSGSLIRTSASKIDSIKNWSISTYKCTRQIMLEKLGKSQRTVDSELEAQIEQLRETQRKYLSILRLTRAFSSHFQHVVVSQHALADSFADLAQKNPELQKEFTCNAETQRNLTKNGELLLNALNFFISSVNTLCNKTIDDTLLTIRQYETARIEFDAYRMDLENSKPEITQSATALEETQRSYAQHKDQYEKLRSDVAVKMQFLDENRIKVMHKQLILLHNAIAAYFSGNAMALESTLKQFNIKLKSPNAVTGSWLEQ